MTPVVYEVIYVQQYSDRWLCTGKFDKITRKAGELQAAEAYVRKWYGEKYRLERDKSKDTYTRGNARGSEKSIFKNAYQILRK